MFGKTSHICPCHLHSWKKCLKVPIRVLALMLPPWIVKSKKNQKFRKKLVAKNEKCFKCLPSFVREWLSWVPRQKKQSAHQNRLVVCHDFHECRSLMKPGKHLEHLSFFATIFFLNFFRFYYSWWYQKS